MSETRTLDRFELATLRFLAAQGGGFTSGTIARECGWGSSRSQMALFRTWTIKGLHESGFIEKIDAEKPAVYVITNEGRYAIERSLNHV